MSNISNTDSTYTTGGIDTRTTLDGTYEATFQQMNGAASGVVAIETILGDGPTLRGNLADLATRLGISMDADGVISLDTAVLSGILAVVNGGTGLDTITSGDVLIGNGASTILSGKGLAYHGPTSTGTGSVQAHEGTVTISGNQALSGTHFYTNFTLDAGVTITPAAGAHRLIIYATGTITINGTIAANGAGATGAAVNAVGNNGMTQPGGGGGATLADPGGVGGAVYVHSIVLAAGGAAGAPASGNGGNSTAVTAAKTIFDPWSIMGGASGGGGAGNANAGPGGAGGASIVLIAPTIVLGAAAVLNTAGSNGSAASSNQAGGGGGGAGNIYICCRTYTDNGATFTQTGGSGGNGNGTGGNGGTGSAGIKQILIYT